MSTPVLLRDDAGDGVALLTLNRPERRNALGGGLVGALLDTLRALDDDPAVRAIVLTGAGKGFCAGGDLAEGLGSQRGFLAAHQERGRFAELLDALMGGSVPVVAAVNGHALGGGFGLAMACDLVVLDPAATLGTPEVKVGLFPMVIAAVLERRVPPRLLRELVFTGGRIAADTALDEGLVNRISEPGGSVEQALELARDIARRSPSANALGKRALRQIDGLPLGASLSYLHQALSLNLLTEDAAEGIAAFVNKREPRFEGR